MEQATTVRTRRPAPAVAPAIAAGGVLLAGCAVAALVDPTGGPALCPFRAVTGWDCPGCGTTRALHFAMRGDLATAAGYNVLFLVALPVLLVASFIMLQRRFGGTWQLPKVELTRTWMWPSIAAVAGFWVLRNLAFAPFSWMGTGG